VRQDPTICPAAGPHAVRPHGICVPRWQPRPAPWDHHPENTGRVVSHSVVVRALAKVAALIAGVAILAILAGAIVAAFIIGIALLFLP